jgi:membrane-associated phospholipid phosphatase
MSRPPREPSRPDRPAAVRGAVALAVAAGLLALPGRAVADESPAEAAANEQADARAPRTTPVPLRFRLALDLPITLGLGALAIGAALAHDDLSPASCRVCDGTSPGASNALDEGVRDALRRGDTTPARTTSHVLAFGAAPLFAFGLDALAAVTDERTGELAVDALVIAQATAAAAVLDQGLGLALARERPRFHEAARTDDTSVRGGAGAGGLGALPSSHTTFAFALAASSGTVASMRGYRLAPLVWGAGMAVGVATAYTRIASDDAWLTDTLASAGLGTAVGALVPILFHGPKARGVSLATHEVRGGRVGSIAIAF